MQFPGFENIFSLGEPWATRPYRGSLRESSEKLDSHALKRGEITPSKPIAIVPYGGREPGDFIWTDALTFLVSERVLSLFRQRRVSGWSTYPVQVYDRERQLIPGFSGFAITGRCGKIDPALSTPIQKQMPARIVQRYKGYLFDSATWDGSDIFAPDTTAFAFVTKAVCDLLRSVKAKNVQFRPITEMDYSELEKTMFEKRLKGK
jgi:hypothetical protein